MFYEPLWDYKQYTLARRPDTPNLSICWYSEATGRYERRSTKTGDLDAAKDRLVAFAAEQASSSKRRGPAKPDDVAVAEVIDYYLERHMKPGSPSRKTTEDNLVAIERFCVEFDVEVVADIHADVIDEYPQFRNELYHENQLRQLKGYKKYQGWTESDLVPLLKDISDATISRELSVLISALRFYKKRGKITRVPFIQKPQAVPPRSRWLTRDEFARLHAAANTPHLRDYMMLAIHTLQRPRFLYDLKVDQIDLPRRRIEFLRPGMRQTKKRRPAIRISEGLVPLLERLIDGSQSGSIIERNGQPIQTTLRKSFHEAVADAGLIQTDDEPIVPYTLRHTGATWLAQAGVDLWQISGMLGHKDTRMVERVYAKHHPDFQKGATEALDRLVPVIEPPALTYQGTSDGSEVRGSRMP